MKKINRNIFIICFSAAIGAYLGLKHNKKQSNAIYKEYIEENLQYKPQTRFIEFFDKSELQEAYHLYEGYLDMGLDKESAFKTVIEKQKL